MPVRGILFDLDDTLLRVDMDAFMKAYFGMLAPRFRGKCDPETFARELVLSLESMVNDLDGSRTNKDVFEADFFPKFGVSAGEWTPQIEDFYRNDFPRLRTFSTRDPLARRVVEAAVGMGYKAVLATNPVYPRAAIVERLSWAGIDPGLFELITTYEIMHFCKPHSGYYREICSVIGLQPSECMMVGNDVDEDLAASKLGMKTFLVNGAVRNRDGKAYSADYEGTLADLLQMIERGSI
ncbi:MAG: HAD family hydrolase [Ignavibacteriales bacterium]